MFRDPRAYTKKVLALIDEGALSPAAALEMTLRWLSDSDVMEMAFANDLFCDEEEEDFEEEDEDSEEEDED